MDALHIQMLGLLVLEQRRARLNRRNQVIALAILDQRRRRREERQRERNPRSCWQRPWVALRKNMGKSNRLSKIVKSDFRNKQQMQYLNKYPQPATHAPLPSKDIDLSMRRVDVLTDRWDPQPTVTLSGLA
jgi:hypothetical protein